MDKLNDMLYNKSNISYKKIPIETVDNVESIYEELKN